MISDYEIALLNVLPGTDEREYGIRSSAFFDVYHRRFSFFSSQQSFCADLVIGLLSGKIQISDIYSAVQSLKNCEESIGGEGKDTPTEQAP